MTATDTTPTIARPFEPRQQNPAFVLPDLRVSQINGCSACVQGHWEEAKRAGEADERIVAVSAWQESPYFDDAERAALALADALTRLADAPGEAVPDHLWREVTRHYDTEQVSALILQIGTLNLFNRINVAVRERADRPSWKQ